MAAPDALVDFHTGNIPMKNNACGEKAGTTQYARPMSFDSPIPGALVHMYVYLTC